MKSRGFNFPSITDNLSNFRSTIKEYHRIPEESIEILVDLIRSSVKSMKTLLEEEDHDYIWDDSMYSTVLQMVSKCPTSFILNLIKIKNIKFKDKDIPINYITKVLRMGIQSLNEMNNLIEPDIESIRCIIKINQSDIQSLSQRIPREFNQLIVKINKMDINRESKILLTNNVNEHHRRFQEWITKKSV